MVGEQHYSELFQALPTPCVVLLPDAPHFTVVNVSNAYLAIVNTSRDAMVGNGFFEVFPSNPYQNDAIWKNIFDEVIQTKKTSKVPPQKYAFPTAGVPTRLDMKYLEVVNTPVLDNGGEIKFIIRSMTDVTNIIHHEKFFEETQRAARIGSWEVNLAHQAVLWSEGLREIYEVAPTYEPVFRVPEQFYPDPEARRALEDAFVKAAKDSTVFHLTLPMVTAKGNERWLSFVGTSDLVGGTCVRIYGIAQDITDSKRLTDLDDLEKKILEMSAQPDIPLSTVLSEYLLGIETLYKGMYCSILGVRDTRLVSWVAPSLPKSYIDVVHDLPIGDNVGSCGTAAYRKERIIVSDIATDPKWADVRDAALAHGLKACWSHPIIDSSGDVIAVLGIYYKQAKFPDPEELLIIDRMSALLNIIIEKRFHLEAIETQNKKLQEIAWMQSHMVRAPLARIMGLVDLIKNGPPADISQDRLLNEIYNSATELDNILGEITEKAEQISLGDK